MLREHQRRIGATLILLFAVRALHRLPIPGVNHSALGAWFRQVDGMPSWDALRAVGGLGIWPYIIASAVIVLVRFARRRHTDDAPDPGIERQTLLLAGAIATALAYSRALMLEGLSSGDVLSGIVLHPGLGWRLLFTVTQVAGFVFLLWLAHRISRDGIGNGVCVIVLSDSLVHGPLWVLGLLRAWSAAPSRPSEDFLVRLLFPILPVLAAVLVVALAVILGRWHIEIPKSHSSRSDLPRFPLRVCGVGILGLSTAEVVLAGGAITVASLLLGPIKVSAFLASGKGATGFVIAWGAIAFLATLMWTAWVYRPTGLRRSLDRFERGLPAERASILAEYRSRLERIAILFALALLFLGFGSRWLEQRGSFLSILSPLAFFPFVVILLDLAHNYRLHKEMSLALDNSEGEFLCAGCGIRVGEQDTSCPGCGVILEDGAVCATHPDQPAAARCIVCGTAVCPDCGVQRRHRHHCKEHEGVETIEGWATAVTAGTRLEAELIRARIEESAVPARVLSNTVESLFGSLGLFEVNSLTPFLPHREIASGRIRVMVPAARLLDVRKHLAAFAPKEQES